MSRRSLLSSCLRSWPQGNARSGTRCWAGKPDLAFLVAGKFLELELTFVDEARFGSSRKSQRILDRRESPNGGLH